MTDLHTAAKLALEALEYYEKAGLSTIRVVKSIIALREALNASLAEHQHQEPVAWYGVNIAGVKYLGWKYEELDDRGFDVFPLYTSPPASKPWVSLTDEEMIIMSRYDLEYAALIGEVQRKLKEKNT